MFHKRSFLLRLVAVLFSQTLTQASTFQRRFQKTFDRTWAGQDYWANRLQDGEVKGGRFTC